MIFFGAKKLSFTTVVFLCEHNLKTQFSTRGRYRLYNDLLSKKKIKKSVYRMSEFKKKFNFNQIFNRV